MAGGTSISKDGPQRPSSRTPEELLHELQVHQVELEAQAEELRRIQQDLGISRRKYLDLYEFAPTGYLSLNDKAIIIEANLAAAAILGTDRKDLIGARFRKFVSPVDRELWDHFFQGILQGSERKNRSLVLVRPEGSECTVHLEGIRYSNENGSREIRLTASDISDIMRVENALRMSEEKYRLIAENTTDTIWIFDMGLRLTYTSPSVKKLRGFTVEEAMAQTLDQMMTPSSVEAVMKRFEEEMGREATGTEDPNRAVMFETEEYCKDGSTIHVENSARLLRDKEGRPTGILGISRDITGRKIAQEQRERLIRELEQKNAELDRFTYTVSHDLKSPLIAIRAFLSLLEEDLAKGDIPRVSTDIARIGESAEKLENMINTLLTLSRSGRTVSSPLPVPFADIVREAAGLLDATLRERGAGLVIRDNLPFVMGDPQRLLLIMTNLLDNAVKFMGGQDHPEIEVGVQQADGVPVFFVRDNGSGIGKENLSRVFGLYERLNPGIPGTGIGLATVKRIVEAHGGRVWAESEGAGKGTTIRFTLPGPPAGRG